VAAELVMRLGHSLFAAALPWWMMEAWGSDRGAGWATVALHLPYLVLSLPAGATVDRVGRRRLMVAVSLGGAAVAAVIPLLHGAGLLDRWLAFVLAVLLSSTSLVLHLARSSLLPELVSETTLTRANAISSIIIGMSLAAGNALIGPVTAAVGLSGYFHVPAATLLLSAVLLATVSRRPDAGVSRRPRGPGLSDLGEGLRYAWSDDVVRQLFALDAPYFVLASGLFATGMPLFVGNSLSGGAAMYGYIGMAGNLGMLVGALFISRLDAVMRRTRLITVAWLCYGAALLGHPLLHSLPGSLGTGSLSRQAPCCSSACPALFEVASLACGPSSLRGPMCFRVRLPGFWSGRSARTV